MDINTDKMDKIVAVIGNYDESKQIKAIGRLEPTEQAYLIEKFNHAYRNGNNIISDAVYDALESMTGNEDEVGYDINDNSARKQPLPIDLSSLSKVKSYEEYVKWVSNRGIASDTYATITPKYDGISLLSQLGDRGVWTRGRKGDGLRSDGHIAKMLGSKQFKFKMNPPTALKDCSFVNGEAIIKRQVFEDADYRSEYANSRSFVASCYSRDDVTEDICDIDYIAYSAPEEFDDKDKMMDAFNEINEVKVPYTKIKFGDITDEVLQELFLEYGKEYEIDGLVIDINDQYLRDEFGKEPNGNPKYAVAWKGFSEESKETTIVGVEQKTGKTGNIALVAELDPIVLDNTTVSRVTLYNAKFVVDNNIEIGTKVTIIKSGNIIPKIIAVEGVKI